MVNLLFVRRDKVQPKHENDWALLAPTLHKLQLPTCKRVGVGSGDKLNAIIELTTSANVPLRQSLQPSSVRDIYWRLPRISAHNP